MSLLEAQEWLNHRIDNNQPLHAVLAELECDGDTKHRMISVVAGELALSTWLSDADWTDYGTAVTLAEDLLGYSCRIKNKIYEVDRTFLVEKDTGYRILEEVDIDAT